MLQGALRLQGMRMIAGVGGRWALCRIPLASHFCCCVACLRAQAQHAAGHRLRYQLHAVLLHCPIGLLRAGNSTV